MRVIEIDIGDNDLVMIDLRCMYMIYCRVFGYHNWYL